MVLKDLLSNPKIAKFSRDYSVKEYIFEEGFLGDALYLIVEGSVAVYKKTPLGKRMLFTAHEGDIIGEKALISDPGYKRMTSAQALNLVTALEVDRRGFAAIQTLMPDIYMKMLKSVEQRLDQATELNTILLSTNPINRVVEFIQFYFKHNKKFGKNLQITPEDISSATQADPTITKKALESLTKKKILMEAGSGYTLLDSVAMLQYAPELRERLAA